MNSKAIYTLSALALLVLSGCAKEEPIEMVFSNSSSSANSSELSTSDMNDSETPRSVLIEVPFTSQAPDANWDPPYNEACEEASLIMVQRYLAGEELTTEEADQEILNLTTWIAYQNLPIDVTIQQLAKVAEEYYSLQTKILTKPTVEDIKAEVAQGNPVILPLAGQRIGNPYFSGDGPPYHMLVVIGYNSTQFITNDPGTKRGQQYRYKYDTIMNAIHNWNGSPETIETGEPVALVVTKN